MHEWDVSSPYEHFRLNLPEGPSTFIFKLMLDDSSLYAYNQEHILFGRVSPAATQQDITGSGDWAVGFIRVRKENTAKMFFRIGYQGQETFRIYSPEFPLFDGNIYSVMLRKNPPDNFFEFTPNVFTLPATYDLIVQRNEYGNKIIRISSSAICYNTASNLQFNGTASYFMLGGWFTDINGRPFVGALDKLQIWYDALPDSNFVDYVNSINAYSFTGSRVPHQSLMFRMHTDYPFDLRQIPPDTVLTGSYVGLSGSYGDWIGSWTNANPFYASHSSEKFSEYLNILTGNGGADKIVSYAPWAGHYTLTYDSASCQYLSQSVYPFQFKVIEYPSTWGISKYGPNKFHNEKTNYISQSVITRFDSNGRSTFVANGTLTPDSTQIGLFADPQDFKNRDIVRYFGNFDFMDAIGSPQNQYSESYQVLKSYRNMYADSKNAYSGSKTLFNELITLYKLYFNRSIFESISNLMPARSQPLIGVVIEPTILERPKYASKRIQSSLSESYYEDFAKHYSHTKPYLSESITKLDEFGMDLIWTEFNTDWSKTPLFDQHTLPPLRVATISTSYINLPNRDYPVNYGGNYITDCMGDFQYGHFSGDVMDGDFEFTPVTPFVPLPVAEFIGSPLYGYAPMAVTFSNQSINATNYRWNFGDTINNSSSIETPSHTYNNIGIYTVELTASNSRYSDVKTRSNYIVVVPQATGCNLTSSNPVIQYIDPRGTVSKTVSLGTGLGTVYLYSRTVNEDARNMPKRARWIVNWNSFNHIDTINNGNAVNTFQKTSAYPTSSTITISNVDIVTTDGDIMMTWTMRCPIDPSVSIPCPNPIQYSGFSVAAYYDPAGSSKNQSIELGSGTGIVTLNYNSTSIPLKVAVRFIVSWNDADVIDFYNYAGGSGQIQFIKSLSLPSIVSVNISAISNELYNHTPVTWSYTLSCPA